jgi:hypothetical protein
MTSPHLRGSGESLVAERGGGDGVGLLEEDWGWGYHLEDLLVLLYQREEEYWRQRSRVRWTLQGDANTAYFHAIANGRHRKCAILVSPDS